MSSPPTIPPAKSPDEWTKNDRKAHRITVAYQTSHQFFDPLSLSARPDPSYQADSIILQQLHITTSSDDASDGEVYTLLRLMELAMQPDQMQEDDDESAVIDFAAALLRVLRYAPKPRIVRSNRVLPLYVSGEQRQTKVDLCIMDGDTILLIVQAERRLARNRTDMESQIVGLAIAAFQHNNRVRHVIHGLEPHHLKVIPIIVMNGTAPIFFRVPVGVDLVQAVEQGTHSTVNTVVSAHLPQIKRPAIRNSQGMIPLDNREAFLKSFEAFKQLV